ncbi:MAG TPA: signal recognition particle-docking protein FtsY [Polyangia bacterium]|nr:signal recognition particle-docking protein FtsY [Polyangia bacterium]
MEPGVNFNPTELIELAAILGGIGVTGIAGYLAVRRARAARRRQIEQSGEGPANALPRREAEAPEPAIEPAPEPARPLARPTPKIPSADVKLQAGAALPQPAPAPVPAPTPAPRPVPEPAPERVGQVIPFPAPASVAVPVEKPSAPAPSPVRKKRDAAALAPGLAKTRSGWISRLGEVFAGRKELDPAAVDEIEKILLTADIGVRTSQKLLEELRQSLTRKELREPEAVWRFLRQRTAEILTLDTQDIDFGSARPFVLLIIGVNGSGKTTTIGKLAAKLTADGKKVLLAAGDTFRAAAIEQLEIWGNRVGATLVRGKEGADPSSVIFEGARRAAAEGFDVVIADTAGRLHTKTDLMQELQKVRRVLGKAVAGAPHETWLVIDSTSGQNAIAQAQIFTQAMQVTGIVLTKLDGTAKGGVVLGIADQLRIPVRFIGIGEKVDDLRQFDPEEFVEALYQTN